MNTAINLLIGLAELIVLILAVVLAVRARRQFGAIAPLGFLAALLAGWIALIVVARMSANLSDPAKQEVIRQRATGLATEDSIFFLSVGGHATGIWFLGAICFLSCGLLDLKAEKNAAAGMLRLSLVVGGTGFIVLSAFYPYLVITSWL